MSRKPLSSHLACLGFVALLIVPSTTSAQVAPPLGIARQFAVLGNSGVTGATGLGALINGDVGSSPTATISNFPPSSTVPPFTVHNSNDGVVQQAHLDAISAWNALLQGPATPLGNNLVVVGPLVPGIYSSGAADLPVGSTLTLNDPIGTGIYIFIVTSSLTANVTSNVVGANACNIYWRVGSDATLNGVNFRGTVIANGAITVGSSSNLAGRALAGTGATGAVTMAGAGGNTIGGCSATVVPTLPPAFVLVLALALAAAGYFRMRRRASAGRSA
jgi:hypothetical protein